MTRKLVAVVFGLASRDSIEALLTSLIRERQTARSMAAETGTELEFDRIRVVPEKRFVVRQMITVTWPFNHRSLIALAFPAALTVLL